MKEASAEQVFELYERQGVGSETLLSRAEFSEFWNGQGKSDQDYWIDQFHLGPTGLSKELLAGFSSGAEEVLDPELLKNIADRLRSLGAFSTSKR